LKQKLVAGAVLLIVLLSLVVGLVLSTKRTTGGGITSSGRFGDAVGLITINGVIMSGRTGNGFFGTQTGAEDVITRLRAAAKDPGIKAVVLRLNSPGGTASGAQEIGVEVDRLRQAGKKVVASMGDVSASGAYWIASRADKIVANPGSLTGSIGVIMSTQDLRGLYEKIGIGTETFKSGPHKDMGSPARAVSPEERAIFQGMVDDIYEQFLTTVAEGRKMNVATLRQLADGRVFTGRHAKEAGLVDELGNYGEAISLAGQLTGLGSEPRVVELGPRGLWQELFGVSRGVTFRDVLQMAAVFTSQPGIRSAEREVIYPAIWLLYPVYLTFGEG
jgi:protease-4